jgi:outer membrane protein assembly factor BamA
LSAALFMLLLSMAWGQDVPWYVGERVGGVQLEAPDGGLPEENPLPLLRVQEGELLILSDVRQDVSLLYQIGHFAAVEAVAIPWLSEDEDGEVRPSVLLRYRVKAAPRISEIRIDAPTRASRAAVEASLSVHTGDVFHVEERRSSVVEALEEHLAREGWPDAEVRIEVGPMVDGRVPLEIEVTPGVESIVGEITIAGEVVRDDASWSERRQSGWISSRQARRWLWRSGVREGQRLRLSSMEDGQSLIDSELYARGWRRPSAQTWLLPQPDDGPRGMSVIVRGGQRLVVEASGLGLPRGDELDVLVGFTPGVRVDTAFAEEVEERVSRSFADRGYRAADVETRLEPLARGQRLSIQARRGPITTLRRIKVAVHAEAPQELTVDVQDAEPEPLASTFDEAFIAGAMREAAPETLGDGLVSEEGIARAIRGVEELYRGSGFLSAEVHFVGIESRRFRPSPLRVALVAPSVVEVRVVEGPRTILDSLGIEGDLGLARERVEDAAREMVGEAYGPARLESLARELVELYRQEGYLFADAWVESVRDSDALSADAMIRIEPGEQIRMRSLVIQGLHRTRTRVVERELELALGEPITSTALIETRSQLYELDLFRLVQIDLVGEGYRSRDVFVQLDERQNILLEAGGGMSTDLGTRARGRALHRNLFGLGHRLSLLGEVGYAWQRGDEWRLDLQAPVWRVGVLYEAPYLPLSNQGLAVEGVLRELIQEPTWRLNRTGASVGLRSRGLGWGETWLNYRVQWRSLEDVDPGALVAQDPWLSTLGIGSDRDGDLTLPSGSRLYMGPEILFRVDRRSESYQSLSGAVWTGQVGWNHGPMAVPSMLRAETRLVYLMPVGPLGLAMSSQAGIGWAKGDYSLPIEDRFHLGGSSLRGFRQNSVGPANLVARSDIDFSETIEPLIEGVAMRESADHWVPTGGDSVLSLQLELRVPLSTLGMRGWDTTYLVFFTDWGHVGFVDSNVQTTSSMLGRDPWARGSVGTGFKWATPIGPATTEVGMNLSPMEDRSEARFVWNLAIGEL